MSPVFAARRRAEEFDALLEGTSSGPVAQERYAELLDLVGALRATPPAQPRPEFVADLRERLLVAAETELTGTPAAQDRLSLPRRSPRERRLAIAVGGFAVIGATTSMAVAAQSALPGDALYPLKRAIENAHTGLSVDDEGKGATLLANASGRLEEVDRLTRGDEDREIDVAAVQATLDDFTAQATEASNLLIAAYTADGDDEAIAELQQFTDESFEALNQLAATVDDPVREALVPVGNALAAIEAALQEACPACGVPATQLPPWMLSSSVEDATSSLTDLLDTTGQTVTEVLHPEPGKNGQATGPKSSGGAPAGQVDPGDAPVSDGDGQDPVVELPPIPGGPGAGSSGSSPGGSSGGQAKPDPVKDSVKDPVKDLVEGLLGGGGTSTPASPAPTPEDPVVGPVLDGVGEVVDGLLDPLKPKP
jgi:hypothetical protein